MVVLSSVGLSWGTRSFLRSAPANHHLATARSLARGLARPLRRTRIALTAVIERRAIFNRSWLSRVVRALLRSAPGNATLLRRLPLLRSRSVVPPVASAFAVRLRRFGRQRGIFYLRCRLRRPLILHVCVVLRQLQFAYTCVTIQKPRLIDSPQSDGGFGRTSHHPPPLWGLLFL